MSVFIRSANITRTPALSVRASCDNYIGWLPVIRFAEKGVGIVFVDSFLLNTSSHSDLRASILILLWWFLSTLLIALFCTWNCLLQQWKNIFSIAFHCDQDHVFGKYSDRHDALMRYVFLLVYRWSAGLFWKSVWPKRLWTCVFTTDYYVITGSC